MSITIKNIYKVNQYSNLRLMDDCDPATSTVPCTTAGVTGPDESGTSSSTAPTQQDYTTYVINWWITDLITINNSVGVTAASREIDQYIPPWPPISYTDSDGTFAAFSYICWNGKNYSVLDDPSKCLCNNGLGGDMYGLCPRSQYPPLSDKNGGAQSTPFYPTGNILINQAGNYAIELILDGYSPACDKGQLPDMRVSYYESISDMQTGSILGIPPNPYQNIAYNYFSKVQVGAFQVSSPYNDQTYTLWWPTKDRSTFAPPPTETTDSNGNTTMTFNGVYFFKQGWVISFALRNTCTAGTKLQDNYYGSFTGTIQITPQFTTYPQYPPS